MSKPDASMQADDVTQQTIVKSATPGRNIRPVALWACLAATIAVTSEPLIGLYRFAADHELFSYITLIPFVSFYCMWVDRRRFTFVGRSCRHWSIPLFVVGLAMLAVYYSRTPQDWFAADALAAGVGAFLALLAAVLIYFLPAPALRAAAFPVGFLVFLLPLPTRIHEGLEFLSQHASAAMASWILRIANTPVYMDGTLLQLPGFSMQVAPECSGLRSTIVLFIVSVVAGKLFLSNGWSRLALALLVIPIAIVRNGLRIFTIGELCVNVGPHMIHSWIHTRGGPIFFAISLAPLFAGLFLLLRLESRTRTAASAAR